MPISGLVVSLTAEAAMRENARAIIASHPNVEVGETGNCRMAIAVETNSREEDQAFWQWLNELPGVSMVDVAFVAFDSDAPGQPAGASPDVTGALANAEG